MLFENFLNTISYFYYPKDKSIFDLDYNDSVEFKRYIDKVHFNNLQNNEVRFFFEKLEEKIFPLLTVEFKMGSNSPSYNFQIILESNNSTMSVVSIYISHLIPFFHVCQLEGINDIHRKDVIINTVYSPEVYALINLIKTELTNELIYYEFPNHILLKKALQSTTGLT